MAEEGAHQLIGWYDLPRDGVVLATDLKDASCGLDNAESESDSIQSQGPRTLRELADRAATRALANATQRRLESKKRPLEQIERTLAFDAAWVLENVHRQDVSAPLKSQAAQFAGRVFWAIPADDELVDGTHQEVYENLRAVGMGLNNPLTSTCHPFYDERELRATLKESLREQEDNLSEAQRRLEEDRALLTERAVRLYEGTLHSQRTSLRRLRRFVTHSSL